MSLVFNTKTYTLDAYKSVNSVTYNGAAKTASVKDDLQLGRTAPKPTAVLSGVSRSSAKLTRTLTLTGALTPTGDIIGEINISVPVGYTAADVDTFLNDFGALLSGADMKTLVKNQKVSY